MNTFNIWWWLTRGSQDPASSRGGICVCKSIACQCLPSLNPSGFLQLSKECFRLGWECHVHVSALRVAPWRPPAPIFSPLGCCCWMLGLTNANIGWIVTRRSSCHVEDEKSLIRQDEFLKIYANVDDKWDNCSLWSSYGFCFSGIWWQLTDICSNSCSLDFICQALVLVFINPWWVCICDLAWVSLYCAVTAT